MRNNNHRRDRLVRPRLQLRLILAFLGVATLALVFQFVLFATVLSSISADLPSDGQVLLERSTGVSVTILLISLGVLLPLSFFVGVLVTFRVAGPLYRFERHLETIAAGKDPGVCRIRKGDELHDFCTTFNAALDRMRQNGAFKDKTEPAPAEKPEPARVDKAA
jgi:hypothetical protein